MSAIEAEVRQLMEPLQNRVAYLTEQIEALTVEVDKLRDRIRRYEAQREGLLEWEADLRKTIGEGPENNASVVAEKFIGKSAREAVEMLARESGGVLVAREAVRKLKKAGFFTNPKNAGPTVYNVLHRGYKKGDWLRRNAGVYELVKRNPDAASNGHQPLFNGQ